MKLNIKKIIVCSIVLSNFQINNALATGWELPNKPDNLPDDLEEVSTSLTDWLLGFIVSIAVLMLIWGGIQYVGSSGDQDKARNAKQTIKYALMGLIIAGIAYATVRIVVTGIL
jgi:amino acid transporter